MKSFFKNPHNSAAWNYRMWVLRLSHVFIFIIHLNRQEVMFVSESKDNKSYLRDTNETIFASRWRVFSKTHKTQQHGITECEYCVYLMFSFSLFTSTDRRWCLFPSQKITKAIFATPTKQFLRADEEFSSKTHITQQHGNTERECCVYLTFSFSLFTSFNRQDVMLVCASKDNKSYLRDTNKTIFASRWRVFFKIPHNSAAWNYRTWVLRLSHVLIFNIHLIQQTGSDACLRIGKKLLSSRHQRNNFC